MNKDDLTLGEMALSEMGVVMDIERRCFEHAPWKNPHNFFNTPNRTPYIVRNAQDEIVGYLLIEGASGDEVFTIFKMAVHPDEQGKGIGTFILDASRKLARASGAKTLFLSVRKSNVNAIRLYERNGFLATKEDPNGYRKGADETDRTAIEMGLPLS